MPFHSCSTQQQLVRGRRIHTYWKYSSTFGSGEAPEKSVNATYAMDTLYDFLSRQIAALFTSHHFLSCNLESGSHCDVQHYMSEQ